MGKRMREAREALKDSRGKPMTEEAMGKKLDKTKQSVSAYEKDRNDPSLSVLRKFCAETGTSLDFIVFGVDPGELDKRANAMPASLREYVRQALELAENASSSPSSKFLQAPSQDTIVEFTRALHDLSKNHQKPST